MANMLSTIDLGLITFIDPELTWTTVKKGFRTASRRSKKPARILPGGMQQDDKSSKRGEVLVSEAEKLGASVLGQRFAEKKHVPFKKRRLLLHSSSTPPQTPSLQYEESLPSQPWTSSPQPGDIDQTTENKHVSGHRWHSKAVFSQDNTENAFLNEKFSELPYGKVGHGEDFSGIALLAAAACNTISDDTCNPREGPIVDNFSLTEGTHSAISATHLEKTTASLGLENLSLKVSIDEDVSAIHDKSMVGPSNFHFKGGVEAERRLSSRKVVRLHWDLNTVMDAWEVPGDAAIPNDGVRNENPEKLGDFVGYRDHDLVLEPFPMNPVSVRHLSEENISTLKKVHLEKHEISPLDPAVSDKVVSNSDSLQCQEVSRKIFHLPDNSTSPTELVSSVTCQMSDVEYSAGKSGKSGSSNYSPEDENSSVLVASFGEGQAVVDVDVERKHVQEASTKDAILLDSLRYTGLKKSMPKSCGCFEKFDIEDGCGSVVSHGGNDHVVCDGETTQIEQGYNSPFEDGELRESNEYPCAESEVEVDTECVDYDYSDYRGTGEFNAANQCLSEGCSDSCLNDKSGGLQGGDLQFGRCNFLKESSHSTSLNNFTGQTQLPEGCECSTVRNSEVNDTSTQNNLAFEFMHGHEVESSSVGEFRPSKTSEKGLSHTEEQSCSDALQRKDDSYMQRGSYDSHFQAGSMAGSKSFFERDRPALPMWGRSQRDGHSFEYLEGPWNSRNNYHTGYPSQRNGTGNFSGAKTNGLNYRDESRCKNDSEKGEYQPLTRWRSPYGSDDGYRAPRRMVAERESLNHISGRMYRQGFSGVRREKYDGHMDSNNAASSSVRPLHYFSGRERSFSPVLSRRTRFSGPHRNLLSQSRSRSPLTFRRQKERNTGTRGMRRCSRSPDFRSQSRMKRVRMPFQKSNYAAVNDDGFISPPRTRFSPQPHLRWIDDERNPRGRLYGKFNSGGSRGRTKPGEYFTPMIRPKQFTDHFDGDVRGQKYDGNWERTNHCNIYEKNTVLKRSGPIRRFRINERDCFELRNSRSRDSFISGADRRDTPRGAREDPLRHSDESMYASAPKLTRIRDYEEDPSPSRG